MSGYIMVDCKGLNLLSQTTQNIPGLYKDMKAAYESDKLVLGVNLNYGENDPLTPVPVFIKEEAGKYIATASILQVWVESDDDVTIESLLT